MRCLIALWIVWFNRYCCLDFPSFFVSSFISPVPSAVFPHSELRSPLASINPEQVTERTLTCEHDADDFLEKKQGVLGVGVLVVVRMRLVKVR